MFLRRKVLYKVLYSRINYNWNKKTKINCKGRRHDTEDLLEKIINKYYKFITSNGFETFLQVEILHIHYMDLEFEKICIPSGPMKEFIKILKYLFENDEFKTIKNDRQLGILILKIINSPYNNEKYPLLKTCPQFMNVMNCIIDHKGFIVGDNHFYKNISKYMVKEMFSMIDKSHFNSYQFWDHDYTRCEYYLLPKSSRYINININNLSHWHESGGTIFTIAIQGKNIIGLNDFADEMECMYKILQKKKLSNPFLVIVFVIYMSIYGLWEETKYSRLNLQILIDYVRDLNL